MRGSHSETETRVGFVYTAVSRMWEKVNATNPKGIVGGLGFTVFQRNLKERHERPWSYSCEG